MTTHPSICVLISRRHKPSYGDFANEFLLPRTPVVLTGALENWNALTKWTPEFFKQTYGTISLQVTGQPYTLGGFIPMREDGRALTMAEFIGMVMNSSDENPAPYLRNVHLEKFLPELMEDVSPLPEYFSPNWLQGPFTKPLNSRLHGGNCELYIGGTGGKFPVLHFDTWHIHTFLSQICGIKEYTIYAPEDSAYLYPNMNTSRVGDIDNVDLNKFPLFAKATRIRFCLNPGETLFVPAGWWHTTKIITPSITLSVSRVNESNWKDFSRDLQVAAPAFLRPMVATYLSGLRLVKALSPS